MDPAPGSLQSSSFKDTLQKVIGTSQRDLDPSTVHNNYHSFYLIGQNTLESKNHLHKTPWAKVSSLLRTNSGLSNQAPEPSSQLNFSVIGPKSYNSVISGNSPHLVIIYPLGFLHQEAPFPLTQVTRLKPLSALLSGSNPKELTN